MVPDRIEQVPEHLKALETFGHQGWIWGTLSLLMAGLFVVPGKAPLPDIDWQLSAGFALSGLLLCAHEVWRRTHRIHLVRDGEGLALYRNGRRDQAVSMGEIRQFKTGFLVMLKIGAGLGLSGAAFTAIGILELGDKVDPIGGVFILLMGLACWASLISAAWTRFFCIHLRVPSKKRWMVEETILVRPVPWKALAGRAVHQES